MWVFDRSLQSCSDEELVELLQELDVLRSEARNLVDGRQRRRVLRRLQDVIAQIELRGVQLALFD